MVVATGGSHILAAVVLRDLEDIRGTEMTPATDADIIKWQLKCLREAGDSLTESEMNLLISFEEQFKRRNSLSDRQMEILEEIYKRRT
jgi:hypothetical protein